MTTAKERQMAYLCAIHDIRENCQEENKQFQHFLTEKNYVMNDLVDEYYEGENYVVGL